jgi:lipopolysaccharide transport system permease protein
MLVFYFLFFRTLNIRVGIAYPVYSFAGLILWGLFSTGITHSSESLLSSSQIIRKIYFPRLLIPLASLLTAMIDFLIAFALLFVLLIIFRQPVSWKAFFCFPIAVILTFLSSFGIGSLLAALNVKYRDFRYIIPFIVQFGIYITPVGYSSSIIADKYSEQARFWYSLNPVVGVVDGFRWCITGEPLYWPGLLLSCGMALFFLWLGIRYFRKTEKSFADNI